MNKTRTKAYKATYNFKCLDQTYNVGKTYTSDKLEMCRYGFHYCEKMTDVLNYYDPTKDFVLLEIEVLGDVKVNGDTLVTNKMKVLRVIPKDEWFGEIVECVDMYEYDERGNMISRTDSIGYKYTYEYDNKGNIIYYTNPRGYKEIYEYDENGNMISETDPSGGKTTYEYDEKGDMISGTDPSGYNWSYKYDEKGNMISRTDTYGNKTTYEYDEMDNKMRRVI